MTLYLLRRPNGNLLPLTRSLLYPGMLARQKSTLSAINDAIRKAQKLLPPHDKRRAELKEGGKRTTYSERKNLLNEDGKPMTYRERQAAREALAEDRPAFKIRKGKKNITIDPSKARPLSRQKQFYDEDRSFAKKSLVHQVNTGKLRDQLKELGEEGRSLATSRSESEGTTSARGEEMGRDRPGRLETQFQNTSSFKDLEDWGDKLPGSSPSWIRRGRQGSNNRSQDGGRAERTSSRFSPSDPKSLDSQRISRYTGRSDKVDRYDWREDSTREDRPPWSPREERSPRSTREDRPPSSAREDRSPRFTREDRPPWSPRQERSPRSTREDRPPWSSREDGRPPRQTSDRIPRRSEGSRHDFQSPREAPPSDAPLSIPYTTAASQFLYGRSVVLAALNFSRRKLYKLYIYGGYNRQNTENDDIIEKKARKKGIEVEFLGTGGERLLDKMAGGRPHNGYVLEASPLPQLPVTGLGPYTESSTDPSHQYKSGYEISLGHQSAEEAAVNGTSPFVVTAPSSRKPLVVLLHQILDPGNLGAILRTVSFLGASAVAITKRASATLTPVALKSSAGAGESITLFSISNSVPEFLENSREAGDWQVYAAVPETSASKRSPQVNTYEVEDMDPLRTKPCILVLGSEGEGLPGQIMSKADYQMSIPNLGGPSHGGEVDSLNVSVAAGLLTSAFMRGSMMEMGSLSKESAKGEALF
ncbi:RNA methyltransferase [Rhypophila decipiens]|uniref:rRNA methyltransferase 1, mitochondrial n=1 Tax=Rhypophila decipiens TaxID=261697 RepID=A0AAN6YJ59_9PEZI|nr:RNA methyltransferase [Rhypophila decipiens]